MRRSITLTALAFCLALAAVAAADPELAAVDEEVLRSAGVPGDGPGLLGFFRRQTAAEPAREKVVALVRDLGDDAFEVREKASAALVALGAAAEPVLKRTVEELKKSVDVDLEVLRRAEDCLRRIGDRSTEALVAAAAARTLARRKPAGTAEALLAYLPGAPSESVIDEIQTTLTAVAGTGGKPDPALVSALADKVALRRAVAGAALAQAPGAAARADVRKLLNDPETSVRVRVALALANAGEKEAVPVLIDLLAKLPQAQAYPLEQYLCRLADEQAPATPPGNEPATREKRRDLWAAWWKEHGAAVDLAKQAAGQPLGYTLVVLLDQGRVLELDAKNQPRWELRGIDFPLDAQLLPGGRVLLAEQGANRVTERNFKGEILWQHRVGAPLVAQRLANGNTFLATRDRVFEVDRDSKEVFSYTPPLGDGVMRAQKLANGQIALVTGNYQFKRIDPAGNRELQSFPVNVRTSGGRIDVLPNNHVLVPEKDHHRVVEYDTRGNVVWQVNVRDPIAAVRLPNGNTLATSMTEPTRGRAVEFNKKGEEVWEYKQDTRVTRAFRR